MAITEQKNINISDLLQQTVEQTTTVTIHNIVDYMTGYIQERDDYKDKDKKPIFDEIIKVLQTIEKRHEVKEDAKNNSKVDNDHNQ